MAQLTFQQITDKLNEGFVGDTRKLIFWYDSNGEFAEDVDNLTLDNAKILHLDHGNQFYIKHYLERVDTTGNYLIYAPFAKPDIRENHLYDMILYSKEFYADRTSLLCVDLGIAEAYKPTVQKYIALFNKERTNAFTALGMAEYNESSIETALMCVLCKLKTASFEEVVRKVLSANTPDENKYLGEFEKFGLTEAFWRLCSINFDYADQQPSLEKLVMTLFATYMQRSITAEAHAAWKQYLSDKHGNVVAFMDNLMNSTVWGPMYDGFAKTMYNALHVGEFLEHADPACVLDCSVFPEVDEMLIHWLTGRLEAEDIEAKLNGKTIPEICSARKRKHYGKRYENEYSVLENAYYLVCPGIYNPTSFAVDAAKKYLDKDWKVDFHYRMFYTAFDKLDDRTPFESLRTLVENIYTNDFLSPITVDWSRSFAEDDGRTQLDRQIDFYGKYIRGKKERVVVIISDAMRYEVGRALFEKLCEDERCNVEMSAMQSLLPSITPFGMAALLPHETLTIVDDKTVLCDGKSCSSLKDRENILKSYNSLSKCAQFDDVKSMSSDEMKAFVNGQDVIYVYHNQIDARGDKYITESEVFTACSEAVEEIAKLIGDFTRKGNTVHFIVTADHGFLYKRSQMNESDKISGIENCGKRYVVTDSSVTANGVVSIPMNACLPDAREKRFVAVPLGTDVFKAPGAGMNYVHGGCSPQEMIVPVLKVKTEKFRVATTTAAIDLVSMMNKITNLNVNFEFLQTEAVTDVVKEVTYRVFFADEDGKLISNEYIHHADSRESDATKRIFKVKFTFKNQTYSKSKKYYLLVVDDKNGMETLRREVIMDVAFAGDFGFCF